MKTREPEWRAIPQFDSGRWKLRLERVPLSADEASNNEHYPNADMAPLHCGKGIRGSLVYVVDDLKTLKDPRN